jgi:hypothetical protein
MTIIGLLRCFARQHRIRWAGLALAAGMLLAAGGCFTRQPVTYQEMSQSAPDSTPRSIAVLPFQNSTPQPDLGLLVRQGFYAHLSYRRFRDVELVVVDHVLAEHGLDADTDWTPDRIRLLGDWLNCDAIVIGKVDRFERLFAAVYSQLSIGAQIAIYATHTGNRIWSDSYVARLHEGDIPLAPLGIPLSGIRTGMNLHEREIVTAVDKLTRYLAKRLPAGGPSQPSPDTYRFELQTGAYRDHHIALAERDHLKQQGYPADVHSITTPDAIWHRVVVGPYRDEQKALAVSHELETLLTRRPLLRREPL